MNPFTLLTNEHQVLLQILNEGLTKTHTPATWSLFLSELERNFESNHHYKEEEFLFNVVRPLERIRGGGPMCTFYFDGHICSSSMSMAQKEIEKIPGFICPQPTNPKLSQDQKSGSPLSIPGEDHESGRILLAYCHYLLGLSDLSESKKDEAIRSALGVYKEIQIRHFQREENCFFKMCESLLSPEEIIKIGTQLANKKLCF